MSQQTLKNNSREYRLLSDGHRFKVQKRIGEGKWADETRAFPLKWLATWRLRRLEKQERTRRRDILAVWTPEPTAKGGGG